uniref:ATPase family AAA domain containing 5a n=1 Tax=Cyprinodon variegatus TaxID=28743 RepID=A0A3Q2FEL8_CYPVA
MAGVVAMASVIEDFDTQPCKKSRKDGSSPVVKTITNYFSPVPKPVEKPFSPPRSNNIMDYFSRKAPSSKEKSSPPQDLKENRQKSLSAEKQANTEVGKKSSEKRGRKAKTQESKDLTVAGCRGALGSDTAALLSKLESDPKCEKSGIPDSKLNTTSLSPKVEIKAVKKAPRKTRKIQQNETKHPEPEEQKAEKSPCDISEDKTSQLNSSTLTISFEDFVRSQNKTEKENQGEEDGKNTGKVEEVNIEQMDIPKAEDAVGPLQVSPRTLTVQAEVHAVSPKQETTKAFGKLASIFTRRKGALSLAESAPPPAEEGRLLPAAASATKRRSNVVLQEEDLELSVIESESTPKSSEAEKKQFMAAFKQPSLDGFKTKPAKSQSKQKQTEEKTAEEEDASGSPADRGSEDTKASKKKSTKQRRNKVKNTEEEIHSSPPAVKETQITAEEEPSNTSTPTVTALRRSRRETVVTKSPENPPTTPVRKTRRQNESKEAGNPPSPQESPAKMSTPKTRRSKHGVFVAEMVSPPDAKESPIRSDIIYSWKLLNTESGNHIPTSKSQILNESKKQKRAKKLVEKAKMIQQSRKTTEKEKVRRSSRIKTCSKKSYCEDEVKLHKTLRSLNEVLGKVTPPAPKTASLGQDKSARKVSAVTSIFDDSSREGSENSQDDEQFRARREFLKSGLPESFRKQIAKTAATKEAYSASSSSFQTVSHTTQPPDDCSLWSLPWPESTMLGHLKDLWSHAPKQPPSISGSLCVKTEPAGCFYHNFCRSGISEGDRQLLMKEFCSKNPHFPAETVFSRLQKRRAEHHQQLTWDISKLMLKAQNFSLKLILWFCSLEWVKEELLWTDKYQPQHSGDIVDNTPAVRRLYSWLKEWKLRADREERKNQKDKKQEEGKWDCGEEDYLDADDTLCNTMLITGPTGVGKTAAVYACAQELGFKVFEVNASSQRSGRLILSQLKEATQSHQVDSQGVNAYKPAYFNSYGSTSVNSPRRVVSSPRKPPQSPRGAKKGGLAPTSLAKFFQVGKQANKEPDKLNQTEKSSEEQSKKMATSLILFEEVDVIFDDDSGFLAAIKTFMSTTKRPVILTTSDPAFSSMFDGNFEEVHFKKPSVLNVGSYLQLLCLAEDTRTHPLDVGALLKLNGCDIRQSLLQLQFWARSAGGRSELKSKTKEAADESVIVPSSLPPCDSGCTESKLGLLNIEPDRDIWDLLRVNSVLYLMDSSVCWELLTDSRRRGVDLLYSNMEHLLPLPLTQLSTSKPEGRPSSEDFSDSCSPVKVSSRMKRNKKHNLPRRDGFLFDSDSEDGFPSVCEKQTDPQTEDTKERFVSVKRKPLTPEEKIKSIPVSQCLQSIADFWDNMSFVDSSLLFHPDGCNMYTGPPVSAVVKDGMTDESRIDTGRGSWSSRSRVLEIQAAVEALSFHKCQATAKDAWDKIQQLDDDLRKEASLKSCPLFSRLAQRRTDIMESLVSKVSGTLGNRQAAALDYLPALRTICRSEQLKEQGKVKRRFLHYLDAIHLGLEKGTLQFLAEDFR